MAAKAQEGLPSKRIPLRELRAQEWRQLVGELRVKPIPPTARNKKLAETSWGQHVLASFTHALEIRKAGLLSSMKR